MHTITVHTPKGGAGRTTSVAALTSGFLNLGLNVLIVDTMGTVIQPGSYLSVWVDKLRQDGFEDDQLGHTVLTGEEAALDGLAAASEQGYDIALIDTPRDLERDHLALIDRSDLIVSPAMRPQEAQMAAGFVAGFELWKRSVGLVTGSKMTCSTPSEVRRAFGDVTVLSRDLPASSELAALLITGDIVDHVRKTTCRRCEAGFAAFKRAQATMRHAQLIAAELLWRLEGQQLVPFEPIGVPNRWHPYTTPRNSTVS